MEQASRSRGLQRATKSLTRANIDMRDFSVKADIFTPQADDFPQPSAFSVSRQTGKATFSKALAISAKR